MISRIFSCKFLHIQIASVSGHSVHFIFKTCQIAAGRSMTRQFHEIFNLIFAFGTTVQQQQQLKRFAAKNSFQTKAFKGQQIPLSSSKKVTESHDALEMIKTYHSAVKYFSLKRMKNIWGVE